MADQRTQDQWSQRAFELAYFIHPDATIAQDIAVHALSLMEPTHSAQYKRLYYKPTGRSLRNRVYLGKPHLLQWLVYKQSELHEKQQEQPGSPWRLDEEDMIIRYIKHLVKATLRLNSFYATLGLSRLLYNYSTAETIGLYGVVVQYGPRHLKEDYYYRKRNLTLMRDLQKRFGDLLKAIKCQHGEDRFQSDENSGEHAGLVKESANVFAPWDLTCVLPAYFRPKLDKISGLSFEGENPDEEHPIESNRFHSVFHSDCLSVITVRS